MGAGLEGGSVFALHVELEFGIGAGSYYQFSSALRIVHNASVNSSIVNCDFDVRALGGQSLNAHKGQAVSTGLHGGPLACGISLVGQQCQRKVRA